MATREVFNREWIRWTQWTSMDANRAVPPVPACPTQEGGLSHLVSHCSPGVSHRKYLQSHLVPPPFFYAKRCNVKGNQAKVRRKAQALGTQAPLTHEPKSEKKGNHLSPALSPADGGEGDFRVARFRGSKRELFLANSLPEERVCRCRRASAFDIPGADGRSIPIFTQAWNDCLC
jgi:hypothetical protein